MPHPGRSGPYRITRDLGQGGMGTVYEAEQREPLRRAVAVKVIRLGMDIDEVLARFESGRRFGTWCGRGSSEGRGNG